MARIRTIKPDFFTSEDIVALSPLARLLYIAIWCEADREGRLVWKPYTFKLRYLPGDNCDAQALCQEIVDIGLVVLYGEGLAVIPKFSHHQHLNPRESASVLPSPYESAPQMTRDRRVIDAQGGREGKGKEGNVCESADERAPPEPEPDPHPADAGPTHPSAQFSAEHREVIGIHRPDLAHRTDCIWLLFCEHYPKQKRTIARWRQWVLNEKSAGPEVPAASPTRADFALADPDSRASVEAVGLARGLGRWDCIREPFAEYKNRVRNAVVEVEK